MTTPAHPRTGPAAGAATRQLRVPSWPVAWARPRGGGAGAERACDSELRIRIAWIGDTWEMGALLPACALLLAPSVYAAASVKPHLFVVLIDGKRLHAWQSASTRNANARFGAADLGYHNVGFHNPDQVSPHINGLVKDGILLEGHYTFQFCSPTRSAFLSGRLPIHVNMEQPSPGSTPGGIDLRMELISQVLKKASYKTHFIGKGQ